MAEEDTAPLRARFAERLREAASLRSPRLVAAFAAVPREHFLGPGPWRILRLASMPEGYETTPDDDPGHLYDPEVLVALDESRRLNNGQPASLARWFDLLDLREGERVLHVGSGVGYYSAVLAEVVGASGWVTAVEIDPELAQRARLNLAPWPQVESREGDGSAGDPGPQDAIFVNAGATRPEPVWLDALRPGGRLLVPLTVPLPGLDVGAGHLLLVERRDAGFAARFVSPVGVFHCAGARDAREGDALAAAYRAGGQDEVRALRRDAHEPQESCWLHRARFCLSRVVPR